MRGALFDFSSWSSILVTIMSLLLMTLLMMGVRLLFMQTIQKKRERENRQINERLRTLIAAYKTLGSSFTGNLTVSPVHLRDARTMTQAGERPEDEPTPFLEPDEDDDSPVTGGSSERQRRTRDAVRPPCLTSSCWVPKTRCAWLHRPPRTWSRDAPCKPPCW